MKYGILLYFIFFFIESEHDYIIEVCVGGGGTSMLNLLSPQEYVRGSFTYIRIGFFSMVHFRGLRRR